MFANLWNVRIGAIVAGILLFGLYLVMGGPIGRRHQSVIQIEFGLYPDEFAGSQVEIDGQVAGELKRFGNAWRTGFEVREGRHAVRIRHPRFESKPRMVEAGVGAGMTLLVLDLQDAAAPDGSMRTEIVLQ